MKECKRGICFGIALLAALILMGTLPPNVQASEGIDYQVYSGEYEIVPDEGGFQRIRMLDSGYGMIGSPGDPALPQRIVELRVPLDIDWSTVELTIKSKVSETLGELFNIAPNPPLGRSDGGDQKATYYWGLEKSIVNGRNTYVYERDCDYPERCIEILSCTQKKRPEGLGFESVSSIRLAYRPFLYNPVRQELTLIKEAEFRVTFGRSGGEEPTGPLPTPYDYVIITTNDIVSNSEQLGFFTHMKEWIGHSVMVVTEDDFDGLTGQAPNGRAEKIRQWLLDNRVSMGIDYVLLIGNPDPDDPSDPFDSVGDIPMKMCWPNYFGHSYRETPTDYFYAELDGNWNLDGDAFFGECLDATHITSPDPSMGPDYFSVIWVGKVMCDYTEDYRFQTFSDDGVVLFIDGTPVIDNWTEHPPANDTVTLPMTAGKHDIAVWFRENTGDGIIRLLWYTPNSDHIKDLTTIPADHLYDETDVVGGLTGYYYDNPNFTALTVTRKDSVIDFIWGTGDLGSGGLETGADVYVGRIPVYNDDYPRLDEILKKIIRYETDPGSIGWREKILLPMKPLWDDTPAYHLGEGIKNDIAQPASFHYFRIYEEDYNPPTPELWPCTKENVKNEWVNIYGMVVWATHGSSTGASGVFESGMTHYLDDSKPSMIFQASCLNGYPEASNNLGYSLLKEGGIATVSASRVSYDGHGAWTFNPASGMNHNLAYFYTKKIIQDGFAAGVSLYDTKSDVTQMGTNLMDYNLYGEPGCFLLTTTPNSPPVADADGPYVENEGAPVLFDGSGSYDPEGEPLEYLWDFENDGAWDTSWSADPTSSRTFGDDHSGQAKLEVRDSIGLIGEDLADVTVNNVDPAVSIDTLTQPNPYFILPIIHTLGFEGSFIDPGWLDTHSSSWDFNDGTVVPGTFTEENAPPDSTGTATADHVYMLPGNYAVVLTIEDDDSGVGTNTMLVEVVDAQGALEHMYNYIDSLPLGAFTEPAFRHKAFLLRIVRLIQWVEGMGREFDAIIGLQYYLRPLVDGLLTPYWGDDLDDWIVDPAAQAALCMMIDDLVAYLLLFLF